MIARFPIISKLDLSRSAEFKSFSLLPSSVKRVQDLKVLILSDCINFQNEHFQQMTEFFSHLEVLDISGTLISDECMDFLSFKAIELKRLDISRCTELTDFGLGELLAKRIRTLEAINISGTSLGYESIRHIERTEEHLHISTLLWSGSRKLGSFSLELKNLQVLDLHNSTHLLDARLVLPSLTFLNLSSSKQIRFLQLEAPLLTVLNLSGCRLLQELNGAFGCIKALNVYACGSLSLPCIRDLILSNASSLAFLDLTGLFQLEDQESIELLKECSQLNDLLISGCKKLTQRSISYILSRFPEALTVTSESSKRRTELFRLPQT